MRQALLVLMSLLILWLNLSVYRALHALTVILHCLELLSLVFLYSLSLLLSLLLLLKLLLLHNELVPIFNLLLTLVSHLRQLLGLLWLSVIVCLCFLNHWNFLLESLLHLLNRCYWVALLHCYSSRSLHLLMLIYDRCIAHMCLLLLVHVCLNVMLRNRWSVLRWVHVRWLNVLLFWWTLSTILSPGNALVDGIHAHLIELASLLILRLNLFIVFKKLKRRV